MSSSPLYLDAVARWLAAARESAATPGEMNLQGLTLEDLAIVAADIEGIKEGCEEVATQLRALIERPHSADGLEDALIEADLSLSHAVWHWKSLRGLLLTHGLWDSALIDDEEEPRE